MTCGNNRSTFSHSRFSNPYPISFNQPESLQQKEGTLDTENNFAAERLGGLVFLRLTSRLQKVDARLLRR